MKPLGINSRRNNYTQCYTVVQCCLPASPKLYHTPTAFGFKLRAADDLENLETQLHIVWCNFYVNHHHIACSCAKRYKGRPWQVAVPLAPTDKSALAAGDLRFRNATNKSIVGNK